MARQPTDAPETVNREQQDEGQAQDVAADARNPGPALGDSRHGGRPNPAQILPDDVPDLVDKMAEMVRSGRIDTGAFAGEPAHDDEPDWLGGEDDEADEDLMEETPDEGFDPLAEAASDTPDDIDFDDLPDDDLPDDDKAGG
jgi:hypothetical protein